MKSIVSVAGMPFEQILQLAQAHLDHQEKERQKAKKRYYSNPEYHRRRALETYYRKKSQNKAQANAASGCVEGVSCAAGKGI